MIALALARLARGGGGASSCPSATATAEAAVNSLLASFTSRSEKTMEDLSSLLLAAKEISASGGKIDASALQAATDALSSFKAASTKTKKLFSARSPGAAGVASSVASVHAVSAAAAAAEAGASVPSSLTSGVVRALLEAGDGMGLPHLDAEVDGGGGALLAAARAFALHPSSAPLARLVLGAARSSALATPQGAEAAAVALRALESLSPAPLALRRQRGGGEEGAVVATLLLTDLRGDASAVPGGAAVSASLSRDGRRVASSVPLTSRGGGVWVLESARALSKTGGEAGVFDATFSVSSGEESSSAAAASLSSRVALPGAAVELKGGSAKVSVVGLGGGGRAGAAAAARTASFPDEATKSLSLLSSPNAKLKIEFELVDSATGKAAESPVQVAALVTSTGKNGGDEAYLAASPAAVPSGSSVPPPGAFVVTLTAGSIAAQQASGTTAGGTYEVELVVVGSGGSAGTGVRWKRVARVELPAVDHRGRSAASLAAALAAKRKEPSFISVQAADAGSAEDAVVGHRLPEIVHTHRAADVPASNTAAALATAVVVLPLLALPWALKTAGCNLRGAPSSGSTPSLLAIAFHASVAALLGSYVLFWAKLTVLEFLPKLLAVGAATVATGHGALRARAAARRSGSGGGSSKKVA